MSVNNCSNNPKFLPWVAFKWTQGESGIAEVKAKFGENFNLEDILSAEEITRGEPVEFSRISDIEENRPQISSDVIITEKDLVRSRLKKELTECAVCKLTDQGVEYYANHSQRDVTMRVNQLKLKYIIEIATKAHLPMGYEYNNQSLTFTDAIERLAKTDPKEKMTPLEMESLDVAITTLLTDFSSLYENASIDQQQTLRDAYLAYYTVTNLDKFALEFSDILQPVKDNPSTLLGQEYKYAGPRSKHLSGYNREDSPVSEILGELQKAVLDYLPQVDSKGHIISSSSIGWNNFLANGLMLRQWAIHEGLDEIYQPEGQINYQAIYEKYIDAIRNKKVPTEFIVPTPEALNGMNMFIFDRKNNKAMDEELYYGFINALSKYVRSNYIEYIDEKGQLLLKPLTERFITLQKLLLENRQKATKALFKKMLSEDNRTPSVLRKQRIPESLEFTDNEITWTVNDQKINLLHSNASIQIQSNNVIEQFMLLFNKVMGVEWDYNKLEAINKQLNTKVSLVKMLLDYMIPVISNKQSAPQTTETLSRIYSLFSGSVSKSVIKNSEGNNLPTYQLGSYAYKLPQRVKQVETLVPYTENIVVKHSNAIGVPFLRNSVSKEGRITTSSALTVKEVQYLAIVDDFAQMLSKDNSLSSGQSKNKGTILIQPTVFSDKNTHYLLPINLNKIECQINGKVSTWFDALTWICKESKTYNTQAKNTVLTTIQSSLNNYYKQIVDNIVADYKEVYPDHAAWTTSDGNEADPITAINVIIKDKRSALITDFASKGKTCVEFAHYSGDLSKGSAGFNNELVEMQTNTSPENFQEWIDNEFEIFKASLGEDMLSQIKENLPAGYKLEGTLWAYYMSDLLFSHDYNAIMVGSFTSHKGKDSSSRWIAATKRMVIYGATVHSLAQGLINGVPQKIKVACVEDIKSLAPLMTGVLGKGDANDGSGYVHPIYSRLANYSYLDGKGGANKKTIFGDMHDKYGVPILLKWAEYEITNERRRQGFNSSNSPESLLKKMSDTPLDFGALTKDLEYTPENLYYSREVYENGIPSLKYFKINTVKINGNQLILNITPSNHSGNPTEGSIDLDPITLDNIWQLDQALGGCWCYTKDSGTLLPSEANQDLLTQIAIDLTANGVDIKSNIISYVINHSAIKVGAANINPSRVFEKDNKESLMTFALDTRYGGMQLNSEHAIEDSDVTEVSQMISALEQLGFTHDKASKVYWDIAKAVEVSLSDLPSILGTKVQDLSPDIMQKYYQVFTDAFIDSFKRNQRDTMGLAQAFIAKAETLLEQYRIPFSAGTLYGIFGSIITSDYVKRAIRRHYSGIGAVLVPTHNSKMLYHINGQYYTYPEIRSKIHTLVGPELSNKLLALYSLGITENDLFTLNRVLPNGEDNPTIIQLNDAEVAQLSIGDTVIISSDEDPNHDQVIVIDDVLKLHICKSKSGNIFKPLLAPRNLSGPVLTWQETRSDKDGEQVIIQQSIYDYTEEVEFIELDDEGNEIIAEENINVPLTLAYLYKLNKEDSIDKAINDGTIDSVFMSSVGEMADSNLARIIRNTIDHFDPEGSEVNNVSDLLIVMTKSLQGKLNTLSKLTEDTEAKVNYKPAQIILGKLFAKQFGIKKGMTINQCNELFFIDQIRNQMNQDFRVIKEIGAINGCPIRGMIYGSDNKPIYIVENSSGEPVNSKNKRNSRYTLDKGKLLGPSTEISVEGVNDVYRVTANGTSFDVLEVTTNDQAQNLLIQLENSLSFTRGLYVPKPTAESLLKRPLYVEQEQQLKKISQEFGSKKFKDFQKSLNMIGARIPCQNMTSFMAMEVVGFSDSETNEVYLPTIVNILQGSDFDIDKQYILGYTVLPDGRILEGDLDLYQNLSPYIKDAITKNNVISGAQSIVRDPANQINLAMPVEMDEVAALAAKADGKQGKLSPFNPMNRYVLQEQNMIGKQVIGIMATGIKSFFALTGVYNEKMNIFASKLAASNPAQWEELEKELDKIVQWDPTSKLHKVQCMLANINIDNLRNAWNLCANNLDIGEDFLVSSLSAKIKAIINFQESLPDVSQSLGQLLNAATDNAKHLYLKKINCDNEWAGIYAYALMIGMPLNEIGDLMVSDAFNDFLAAQESGLFTGSFIDKKKALDSYIKTLESVADKNKLMQIYNLCDGAENLKTLGKALKINQGLQVKDEDSYRMLHQIEQGLVINLEKFLSDDDYKQAKVIEGGKNILNVHAVLANSPHFNAMLKAFIYDRKTKTILSKRSALIQYIENHNGHGDLKYDNRNWTITEKGYKDLREDVNSFFIDHFLTKRKRPILRLPKGYRYSYNFKSYQSNGSSELLIGDARSIAIFKEYIEQHFIPSLKNHWPYNIFVQELFYDHINGDYFYNLPIDLTKATSAESTRRKFREYQRAFNAIKDQKFESDGLYVDGKLLTIGDTIMLYNLLVHKDKINGHSLTPLFEDSVVESAMAGQNNLMTEYNEYIDGLNYDVIYNDFIKWKANSASTGNFYEAKEGTNLDKVLNFNDSTLSWLTEIKDALTSEEFVDQLHSKASIEEIVELYIKWIDENPELINQLLAYTKDNRKNAFMVGELPINIEAFSAALNKSNEVISEIVEAIYLDNTEIPIEDTVTGRTYVLKTAQINVNGNVVNRKCLTSLSDDGTESLAYYPTDWEFKQIMARHLRSKQLAGQAYIGDYSCWVLFTPEGKVNKVINSITGTELETNDKKAIQLVKDTMSLSNQQLNYLSVENMAQNSGNNIRIINNPEELPTGVADELAFVDKGVIYINKSAFKSTWKEKYKDHKANAAVIHELAHLLLGHSIWNKSQKSDADFIEKYSALRGKILDTTKAQELRNKDVYKSLSNYDLAEELIATLISKWYSNSGILTTEELQLINDIFNVFDNLNKNLVALVNDTEQQDNTLLKTLSDSYAEHQKLIAVRKRLADNIEENCE